MPRKKKDIRAVLSDIIVSRLIRIMPSFPWVAYVLFSICYPPVALPLAIILFVFSYQYLRKGCLITWGTFLFFVVLFVNDITIKNQLINELLPLIVSFFVSFVYFISLYRHQPCTAEYAKSTTTLEELRCPGYCYRMNMITTAFLGGVFLVVGLFELYQLIHPIFTHQWIILPCGFGVLIVFITIFPEWYFCKYYSKI